jgi:CelD/BcsL family acetyltransferase involved in cellulose biosynthesis
VALGTELITDRAALRAYEPEWRELAERRDNAFITPEWFWAWLEIYGEAAAPAVIAVRRPDGDLLGLMPLVVANSGRPRTLRFAGATYADHLHPVCLPEDEASVAEAAVEALSELGRSWTVAVLDNVDADARWWQVLARASLFVGVAASRDSVLPVIELGGDGWEGYLATRGRNFRDQARRYPRRLERAHEVSYRCTADDSELDRDMATFFQLHDARWDGRGVSGMTGQRVREFQLAFARSALARGWLRLWFLELDGTPVAAWYGWRIGNRYAYYQAGFSPAWARLSVGFVLMVHTVRSAFDEGAVQYDMLLGEESYKARFTSASEPVRTVSLSRSRAAQLFTAGNAFMWKRSRRLPPRLRSIPRAIATRLPTAPDR